MLYCLYPKPMASLPSVVRIASIVGDRLTLEPSLFAGVLTLPAADQAAAVAHTAAVTAAKAAMYRPLKDSTRLTAAVTASNNALTATAAAQVTPNSAMYTTRITKVVGRYMLVLGVRRRRALREAAYIHQLQALEHTAKG